MMLTPEEYYERDLKKLDASELKSTLKELLDDFQTLKSNLEDPEFESDITLESGQIEQIQVNRQYLTRAIELAEALKVDISSLAFIKDGQAFNEDLQNLKEIEFKLGGPSIGDERIHVQFKDSQALIESSHSQNTELENDLQGDAYRIEAHELIHSLQDLYLSEWQENYQGESHQESSHWDLQLTFEDGSQKNFSGENAYPYNFSKLLEILAFTL